MPDPITTIASEEQYAAWADGQGLTTRPVGLSTALAAATAELQDYCDRDFLPSPAAVGATETRTYRGDGGHSLRIADALTIASATCGAAPVSDHTTAETPIQYLRRSSYVWDQGAVVTVTGRFGYAEQAALPALLVEACCMLTALRLQPGNWSEMGVRSVSVADVRTTYDTAALAGKRTEALSLVRRYRRLF